MTATVEHINKEAEYEEIMERAGKIAESLHYNYIDNCFLMIAALKTVDHDENPGASTFLQVIRERMEGQLESFDKLLECFPEPSQ